MKPIVFDSESVNAILAGRKTQTRRTVKPQPPHWMARQIDSGFRQMRSIHGDTWGAFVTAGTVSACGSDATIRCPYGQAGDCLWVREKWAPIPDDRPAGYFSDPKWVGRKAWYAADNDRPTWGGRWRSPMFMPHWASRITLELLSVRVERLQDISEADAIAEGAGGPPNPCGFACSDHFACCGEYPHAILDVFRHRWDHINGKLALWADNPFVWVLSFRRLEGGAK